MRLDVILDIVSIVYMFMEIIIESEIYHVYKTILLTIYVAACNSFGTINFFMP
jgi:hypothetical protein